MSKAVINELVAISKKARVFVSMPYIEGLTPRFMGNLERCNRYETDEVAERREGIFEMDEATLSPLDHGGLYGDACFEGILVTNDQIFVFKEHLVRWWESARRLQIKMPYTMEDMAGAHPRYREGRELRQGRDRVSPARHLPGFRQPGHPPEEVRGPHDLHHRVHYPALSPRGLRDRHRARHSPSHAAPPAGPSSIRT